MEEKDLRLNFELVPDGCWYSNLRSILSKAQWDYVKKDAKERANGKCAICGRNTSSLEAHERWSYHLDKGVQKLEDVISICHDCHSVIHFGRTALLGNAERAEKHFMKVNNCTYPEFRKFLGIANERHILLNKVPEWKIDISWLKRFTK